MSQPLGDEPKKKKSSPRGWQYGTKAAYVFSGLTMPPSTTRQLLGDETQKKDHLLGASNDQLSVWLAR